MPAVVRYPFRADPRWNRTVIDNLRSAEKARRGSVVDRTGRYADVNQLAFAIVHALEDRDSGLTAEIDALRQQIRALTSASTPAGGTGVDLTVLEAVVEREPELRQELNGAFQQALDQARGGHPESSATLLPLLALSVAQALRRRDAELGAELGELRQQVSALSQQTAELSQQVMFIGQMLGAVRSRVDHRSEITSLRDMLSSELGALRRQVSTIEAPAPASKPGTATGKGKRRGARREDSAAADPSAPKPMPLSEIRLVLDILRRGGSELDGKLEFLRQLGYDRAIRKSGDPNVGVSPAAALLLGVAALLDEHEAR
jgi:hypothetical protein